MDQTQNIALRPLSLRDIDIVLEIESPIIGTKRRAYWESKLEKADGQRFPSVAAEVEGKVIGYVLGRIDDWECGTPTHAGWIDMIGVAEGWQGQGISGLLLREICDIFKRVGISTVCTFVDCRDGALRKCFERVGFREGEAANLEMDI